MASFLIDLGGNQSLVVVRGDAPSIKQNRRLWVFFEHYLSATSADPSEVHIPVGSEPLGPLVKRIEDALLKHGFGSNRSPTLNDSISAFLSEQRRFEEFSRRAREIWQNQVQGKEFAVFAAILLRELPGRLLYPLQLLAAYHLAFSQNAGNFSVPGAGKTSVVYGAFAYLKSLPVSDAKHIDKLLVVGPLSAFGPWEMEFAECFGRVPRSRRVSGAMSPEDRRRVFYSELSEYVNLELLLTTYQSVPNDLEHIKHFLTRANNKVMVVLDEAHKIKNTEGGVWADSILEVAPYASSRVVLSGTPAPNGYQDLYNLFKFIWPDQNLIRFHLNHLRDMSLTPFDPRAEALIDNIAPYFIRIRKSALGLPDPIEHEPIVVPFGPSQERIYRFIEEKYVSYFQSKAPSSWLRDTLTRARLIRLMQAATNPDLLRAPLHAESGSADPHDDAIFVDDAEVLRLILNYKESEIPSKLASAVGLVEQLLSKDRTNKVVVWCVFVSNLFEIQSLLKVRGIESRVLYGGTPTETDEDRASIETRESIIRDFERTDSNFKVVVANPFAVGESISLHKACRNAIYLERNFNAAAFLQSKDRIHRYGLPKNAEVNYYYLIAKDSIDATIHQRLLQKEATMIRILESRDIPLLNMNMDDQDQQEDPDDIAAIIKDYELRRSRIQ